MSAVRQAMLARILAAARRDERILGVLDYGSSSEGRADAWSDLDLALVLGDEAFDTFQQGWRDWAARLGPLLLAYEGGVGHPWTVYDAPDVPLRVDFAFHRASRTEVIATWPNAPLSVEAMVLLDKTGGRLAALAARLVGQPLGPPSEAVTFAKVAGDFWYYLLRLYARLQRGHEWAARHDFNFIIVGNLLALLRLEAGATGHWRGMSAAVGIEGAITHERLTQLEAAIPAVGHDGLLAAIWSTARLGHDVCVSVSRRLGEPWPEALAERVLHLYGDR